MILLVTVILLIYLQDAHPLLYIHHGSASFPPMIQRSVEQEFGSAEAAACAGLSQGIIGPQGVDELWAWYLNNDLASSDPDPSWGKVWDTATHLARWMSLDKSLVKDLKVAELGCGLGLCGLTAAGAGAKSVLFLDQEGLALYMCMCSAAANGFETGDTVGYAVVSAALCNKGMLPSLPRHRLSDVVLASDILYDIDAMPGLAGVILQLLDKKGAGRALIADPLKGRAKGCRAAFKEEITKLGGHTEEVALPNVANREATILLDISFFLK